MRDEGARLEQSGPYHRGDRKGRRRVRLLCEPRPATDLAPEIVTAILDGSLRNATYETDVIFGLNIPSQVHGVPGDVLHPRNTWADKDAYDVKATALAGLFRENDARYDISPEVRAAGPKG